MDENSRGECKPQKELFTYYSQVKILAMVYKSLYIQFITIELSEVKDYFHLFDTRPTKAQAELKEACAFVIYKLNISAFKELSNQTDKGTSKNLKKLLLLHVWFFIVPN